MDFLALWLPILLSAVFVFIVSSVIHMLLPVHKSDLRKLPQEDAVLDALRVHDIPPGPYAFPRPQSMKEMATPEFKQKYEKGPVGLITVLPSRVPAMGPELLKWFGYGLFVSVLSAYAAHVAVAGGMGEDRVFRLVLVVAWLGHGFGSVSESIWKGLPWGITFKFILDGLVYALVTAGTFLWLWPAAASA